MNNFVLATCLLAACALVPAARGQNEPRRITNIAVNDDARCKKEVNQYVDVLQFVRQSAGEHVSAKVMNNYVPQNQLNQLISGSGYCAAAQLLRDKRATR